MASGLLHVTRVEFETKNVLNETETSKGRRFFRSFRFKRNGPMNRFVSEFETERGIPPVALRRLDRGSEKLGRSERGSEKL